jgi:prephenate dehydrogenase
MSNSGVVIPKLVVVGVGLIGGSFSLALKGTGAVGTVVGIGRNRATIERAKALGVIDIVGDINESTLADASLVLVSTPVGQMEKVFADICPHLGPATTVTDGGSTKQDVIAAARKSLGSKFPQFVPGHPIAGTEHSGPEAAFPELYRKRRVVLTPESETRSESLDLVDRAWTICGALVSRMTAQQHDKVLAAVSHLPHLLSFALVEELAAQESGQLMFSFAGGGFRDFTRIASSNPEMWRDISLANRSALSAELMRYRAALDELQAMLDAGDGAALAGVFERARSAREQWLRSQN